MFEDFMIRALFAGAGVVLVCGVLGCFVVWKRMAYFGDSLAHSALLGIALGLLWGISSNLATLLVCSAFALLLVWLKESRRLASDTLLGILAHTSLSAGMIAWSFLEQQVDLHSYLFGDILTVTNSDLIWIYASAAVVLVVLWRNWQALVLAAVHPELAQAEGVSSFKTSLILVFGMTLTVAVAMQVVGILLVTSMLIIPAATARQFARTPGTMALGAVLVGLVAVGGGIAMSWYGDTPSGPSMVVSAAALFMLSQGIILCRGSAKT